MLQGNNRLEPLALEIATSFLRGIDVLEAVHQEEEPLVLPEEQRDEVRLKSMLCHHRRLFDSDDLNRSFSLTTFKINTQ